MNFTSDNSVGASPQILAAILAANAGTEDAYGADGHSRRAETLLSEVFERDVAAFLVATGTAANALALGLLAPPWGAVFCHEEAHIIDDECNAPEFFTAGAKLVGVAGVGGKITPAGLEQVLARYPRGLVKAAQPAALSLSQVTEAGTVYSPSEIDALGALAHAHGLAVHMDGARFANAVAALGCGAADMSWKAGVDVLSFGATKNGALACEAVVVFDKARAASLPFQRKRAGHTLSKGRFLGAQMCAYLKEGHWLSLAQHANAMAVRLADGLDAVPSLRLAWPRQANELFVILPAKTDARLRAAGFRYHPWSSLSLPEGERIAPGEVLARLVASYATREEDVDRLIAAAAATGDARVSAGKTRAGTRRPGSAHGWNAPQDRRIVVEDGKGPSSNER